MEYHLTHDIIHIKELLGHMRIDNTIEPIKLIEAGFDCVTDMENAKIFRERK